jgi:hypothetical protein
MPTTRLRPSPCPRPLPSLRPGPYPRPHPRPLPIPLPRPLLRPPSRPPLRPRTVHIGTIQSIHASLTVIPRAKADYRLLLYRSRLTSNKMSLGGGSRMIASTNGHRVNPHITRRILTHQTRRLDTIDGVSSRLQSYVRQKVSLLILKPSRVKKMSIQRRSMITGSSRMPTMIRTMKSLVQMIITTMVTLPEVVSRMIL